LCRDAQWLGAWQARYADRRLKLEFHGTRITSDTGLLAFRELGDALDLTSMAGEVLADSRTGRNGRQVAPAPVKITHFTRIEQTYCQIGAARRG
jgi:hypothetical protein